MLKKIMFVCVLTMLVPDSFAASTVRKLGGNTVAPNTVSVPTTRKASLTKTPIKTSTGAGNRTSFPVHSIGKTKSIGNVANKIITPTGGGTTITPGGDSTTPKPTENVADLTEIQERLDAIQAQTDNMITDVESNDGNYVTDIAVDGNKLNVNKTNLLYAPVRNSSGDTITGEAEIWIVK